MLLWKGATACSTTSSPRRALDSGASEPQTDQQEPEHPRAGKWAGGGQGQRHSALQMKRMLVALAPLQRLAIVLGERAPPSGTPSPEAPGASQIRRSLEVWIKHVRVPVRDVIAVLDSRPRFLSPRGVSPF